MYSVKPGRGPSFAGIIGGIVVAIFGVIFATTVMSNGFPPIFGLFGAIFVLIGIGSAIYSAINTFGKNRMSQFDITIDGEESDPIADALGHKLRSGTKVTIKDIDGNTKITVNPDSNSGNSESGEGRRFDGEFCPFCGAKAGKEFNFCPKCGKDI